MAKRVYEAGWGAAQQCAHCAVQAPINVPKQRAAFTREHRLTQ